MIDRHRFAEATSLNLVQPAVPGELAAVVAKMMAKDPAKRFQTPAEAAHALRPFVSQPATTPRPALAPKSNPGSALETSRPSRTAPRLAVRVPPVQPEPTPGPAARTPARRAGLLGAVAAAGLLLLGDGTAWMAACSPKSKRQTARSSSRTSPTARRSRSTPPPDGRLLGGALPDLP